MSTGMEFVCLGLMYLALRCFENIACGVNQHE